MSEMFQKESDKVQKSSGSPAFMAPELCVLKRGDISGRAADIWGMGVTLYCLRFGRVPFEKSAVLELYKAIVEDEVNLEKGLGDDFEDLMKQLLEKNPIKRIKMDKLRVGALSVGRDRNLTPFRNIHGSLALELIPCCRKKKTAPNLSNCQQRQK